MADPSPHDRFFPFSPPSPHSENPPRRHRRKAVAIRYRAEETPAPVVVAKGGGVIADRIMELAERHHIPLYRDPDLVTVLSTLDLGEMIPPELYQAVAEILAFIYRMNGRYTEQLNEKK